MKVKNIKFVAIAYYMNGESKLRNFVTEDAMIKWANKQYLKDENVTVCVYDGIDGLLNDKKYCTYHA